MNIWVILLAAGQGRRLAAITGKKQFLEWRERPLYWHSAQTFSRIPEIRGLIVVFPAEERQDQESRLRELALVDNLGLEYRVVAGGRKRHDSSRQGLLALPGECTHVLIHDAARPLVGAECIRRVITALELGARGVVPGLGLSETVKQIEDGQLTTLPREKLWAVQTPQGFERTAIEQGHRQRETSGQAVTDDAALLELCRIQVEMVQGDPENIKITNPADLSRLRPAQAPRTRPCAGWGYDVHRFGRGRPLKLGGIPISSGPQIQAHSDGDVLMHALIDAILGCLAQGDIGDHFPDTNPALENISSGILLQEVVSLARKQQLVIDHLDLTIITQTPKIAPWKAQIKKISWPCSRSIPSD